MIILGLKNYKEEALRTIKEHESKAVAISDWSLGLGGEAGEVLQLLSSGFAKVESKEKFVMELAKELGDVLWYTVALANELQLDISEEVFNEVDGYTKMRTATLTEDKQLLLVNQSMIELVLTISRIQESMKHYIMHKESKAMDNVGEHLDDIIFYIATIAGMHGFTLIDIASLNVSKLAHRFNVKNGGKFNTEASANRHDLEQKFEDTDEYKELYNSIVGGGSTDGKEL